MSSQQDMKTMLRRYGFDRFEHRRGGHIAAYHPNLRTPLIMPNSASDHRSLRNAEAHAREALGLSTRGRTAVEGQRRQKAKPTPRQTQRRGGPEQWTREEKRLLELATFERMMRSH